MKFNVGIGKVAKHAVYIELWDYMYVHVNLKLSEVVRNHRIIDRVNDQIFNSVYFQVYRHVIDNINILTYED